MKKLIAIGCIVIFILVGFSAAAQEDSDIYVKTVLVTKVYPHQDGYRVVYQKSGLELGVVYIPMEWFYNSGARRAQAIYGDDPSYPYLSIFWRDGEFSHLRLYLIENKNHRSWGDLENYPGLEEKFNVDTLQMDF